MAEGSRQFKRPSVSDIRTAHARGKITKSEARDLGGVGALFGKHDNFPGKPLRSEREIAKKTHKSAGLTEGNW
jgi:hypothetical protein